MTTTTPSGARAVPVTTSVTPTTPTPPITPTSPPTPASVFDLPGRLAAKADPALIAADERHFAAIGAALEAAVTELSDRLDATLKAPGGAGREAMERDAEVYRLTARLRTLRRFGLDLCLGRIVAADGSEPLYVGRLGLTDSTGRRLLVDWRSPAAGPFFAATHADPMGLAGRRRYRWTAGRIGDYWDEVFTADGLDRGHAALDDQSAFIASLGASRSPRMRDVLTTIQADQDAVIRAGSKGALVVDGGPGTGKTVVALHRAAYLLYSDPRLGQRRGGVLFVGPHQPYLAYVADVLPNLGEEGVRTCTLRDLLPEGATAGEETDPEAARLKADVRMAEAVEAAARFYEDPPAQGLTVSTPWASVRLGPEDWAEAFRAPAPGTPHNEARDQVWEELVTILWDRHGFEEDPWAEDEEEAAARQAPPLDRFRRALLHDRELVGTLDRAWPVLDPAELVADLWSVPAFLRHCAPWLDPEERARLRRPAGTAWTVADLPLLDAARLRLGDPETSRHSRRREAAVAAERERLATVIEDVISADADGEGAVTMLRGRDLQDSLVDGAALPAGETDPLAGPFAHVVVDEAQELTDAEWQMLLRRCPSRSFTVVGDRAQARHGFAGTWRERLARVGFERVEVASLGINYRTPEEVMTAAEPVIRAALPDANVPTSVRSSGIPVAYGAAEELETVLADWLAAHPEGTACVIGAPDFPERPRVRSLTPQLSKGLEFDHVVLVDPDAFGEGVAGAVDRYVAMTRATRGLTVLTTGADAR
ncbi:RNA polymerase recycling motor ATPase HelR [Streptomyces sp. NPDC097619]|uniref:RNA polymerase recycling motor ATPase HelR n=1 Tax=Streptomyces sp. NPDC097619 TaxID=3157228 RepID=UPI00331B30BB